MVRSIQEVPADKPEKPVRAGRPARPVKAGKAVKEAEPAAPDEALVPAHDAARSGRGDESAAASFDDAGGDAEYVVLTGRGPFWDGRALAAGDVVLARPDLPAVQAMLRRGWLRPAR